jgi:hypothetical protein
MPMSTAMAEAARIASFAASSNPTRAQHTEPHYGSGQHVWPRRLETHALKEKHAGHSRERDTKSSGRDIASVEERNHEHGCDVIYDGNRQ